MLTIENRWCDRSKTAALSPTIFRYFLAVTSLAIGLSNCPSSQAETEQLFSDSQTEFVILSNAEQEIDFSPIAEHSNFISNEQVYRSLSTSEYSSQEPAPSNEAHEYLIPPTVVPEKNLKNVQFTTIPLNNTIINHTTRWEFEPSIVDGSIGISGLYRLEGKVTQSISKNNVFTSEQTGTYLQTVPFAKERTVELVRKDPSTTLGFRLQTSLDLLHNGQAIANLHRQSSP
jgi:hypothetical protein